MDKQAQRAAVMAARKMLSPEDRSAYSAAVCRQLMTLPEITAAKTVFSYVAVDSETDLAAFHEWAQQSGKTLAFPVTHAGGMMEAMVPRDAESWVQARFGLYEPAPERSALILPESLDVVIVPCVAFDDQLRRLGHGAGYYDRYLPQCTKACRIAVAFEAQKLPQVCTTELDAAMDAVVTEARIYRF